MKSSGIISTIKNIKIFIVMLENSLGRWYNVSNKKL